MHRSQLAVTPQVTISQMRRAMRLQARMRRDQLVVTHHVPISQLHQQHLARHESMASAQG